MKKIGLYGNLVVDRIVDDFSEKQRLGGIANAWEALTYLSPNVSVELIPTSVGEAIVLVDRDKSKRTSRARLNINPCDFSGANVDWHHIMYLNSVHDLTPLTKVDGVISADVTTGSIKNLEYLKYIDYLFVSDEDLFMSLDELASRTKGWVILHSSTGSVCHNGKIQYELNNVVDHIDGINVLGAGDIFAAAFISDNDSADIVNRIETAHIQTTNLLRMLEDS